MCFLLQQQEQRIKGQLQQPPNLHCNQMTYEFLSLQIIRIYSLYPINATNKQVQRQQLSLILQTMIILECLRWGINFMLWFLVASCAYGFSAYPPATSTIIGVSVAILMIYGAYLGFIFCTSTFKFLRNMTPIDDPNSIIRYIKNAFQLPLKIEIEAASYHTITTSDHEGRSNTSTVTTSIAREKFPYLSCRDISGPLVIDTKSAFLKLKVELEHVLADETTAVAIEDLKDRLLSQLIRDSQFRADECLSIDGLEESKIFKVRQVTPPCIGVGWYIFFALLTFGNVYNTYVRCYLSTAHFKIVKLISKTRVLRDEDVSTEHRSLMPTFTFNGKSIPLETGVVDVNHIAFNMVQVFPQPSLLRLLRY
eukprot:TRINITY_DN1580_c0_g2_i1.p1 TRINITY_DN1580_c0_g2~~TRINITY_DN1580_c0_g2_i1.p1  ORF type:complete len:403 (+),score=-30.25 TRINITY_DN1580_c0_g2_i1:112-1209(+)